MVGSKDLVNKALSTVADTWNVEDHITLFIPCFVLVGVTQPGFAVRSPVTEAEDIRTVGR